MDRDPLRSRLLEARSRLRREIVALRHGVGATGPDETLPAYESFGQHPTDQASDLLEREVDRSLELDLRAQLEEVDDALSRLDDGTYGSCAVCGTAIDHERLTTIPWARRCVRHEAALERDDRRVLEPDVPSALMAASTTSDDDDDTASGIEPVEETALHIEHER